MQCKINQYRAFLVSITFLFTSLRLAQENTQIKKQIVKGWEVETGYFFNGQQPYAKAGKGDKVLIQNPVSFVTLMDSIFILPHILGEGLCFGIWWMLIKGGKQ